MLEVLSELFTARNQDERYITYTGDYDFFIVPVVEGDLPFQTSSLSVRCYKDQTKQELISFECKWYQVFEGKYTEIKDADGHFTYHLSPYDIGCSIRLAVKSTSSSSSGLAFVTFGPIELDPSLKPYIENRLLCLKGSYQFSLIKYDTDEVNDTTDFSNKIEFNENILGLHFGPDYRELQDFKVDLFASRGLQLRTVQYDNRIIKIYFRRGEEEFISASVLYAPSQIAKRSQMKSQFGYTNMMSFEQDGKSAFINKGGDAQELILPQVVDLDQSVSQQNLLEIVIRFENRLLRDDFITSLRFMRVKRAIPLNAVLGNSDILLRKSWFPPQLDDRSPEYITGCLELHAYR